jgi:plastocyanin
MGTLSTASTLSTPRTLRTLTAAAAVAGVIACGGSSSTTPSTGGGTTPTATNTIVISNNALSPQSITVTRGSQLTITNNDSRTHEMDSDPHPEHSDCPELNQIGFLNPGQSRQSGNLNTARKCGLHDHGAPDTASLKATITIQ